MKLHGMAVSPYVSRVLLVARLKGIDLPLVFPSIDGALAKMTDRMAILRENPAASLEPILFMEGTPFMREVNPVGRMPALEVDGRHLAESSVICEYLDERFPDPPLLPADAFERAKVRQLCAMCDLYLMSHLWPMAYQLDPDTRDLAAVQRIGRDIDRSLLEIEQVMQDGNWARGGAASLADVALLYGVLMYQCVLRTTTENLGLAAFDADRPFPHHARLRAWWAQLARDAAFSAAITRYRADYAALFGQLVPDRSARTYGHWLRARCPRP